MTDFREIFIGFDPKEEEAYKVCEYSIRKRASCPVEVKPVIMSEMIGHELYNRPTSIRDGVMFDDISGAPMSTEFAITRFLVPKIAKTQFPLFMDSDMLVMDDIAKVWDGITAQKALFCVKHNHVVVEGSAKMEGQVQTNYPRKNWSSFCVWNARHPANAALTLDRINTMTGRYLHCFNWLPDDLIGELDRGWNWLEGYQENDFPIHNIHFTRGGPWFPGCQDVEYADVWLREQDAMNGITKPRKRTKVEK
jgi:hypothetical protein